MYTLFLLVVTDTARAAAEEKDAGGQLVMKEDFLNFIAVSDFLNVYINLNSERAEPSS